MNYIRAKFPNSTRSYTYRTEDSVKAGDTVVNAKGAKLTVTDEAVDMKWVETYGADKVAVVKKYEEPEKALKLRVWHIPQVPMKPFHVEVQSVEEAWKILNLLWDYDLFQYKNHVKPDYTNVSGLEYWDEEEHDWLEWYDEETDYDIKKYFKNKESEGKA